MPAELEFRSKLKLRLLDLATIERARKRQCSRINWLRAGDPSTTSSHAKVNTRKRENFILSLNKDGVAATSHSEKEEVIKDHFTKLLGTQQC